MAYDPNDSGEYVRPLPQYLDNLIVEHPVIGTCELWKAIAWDTAQLRNYKMKRADSAGAIAAEAQTAAPSNQPKRAPPLVGDAAEEASQMERICAALDILETRLGALEQRKRQQQEDAARAELGALEQRKRQQQEDAARAEIAEKSLLLAEQIAEETPGAIMDALSPAPKQRLLN
jgi:hypothetical protein